MSTRSSEPMSPNPELITLHEVADRLGVHYMTAYRYVRTGQLPASKDGAEWRVDPVDLDGFAERASTPARKRRGRTDYAGRLTERLLSGDEAGAWSVIESAMTSGLEPEEVYLRLLSPAMQKIGERWVDGEVSIADEHQASAVMLRLIGRLGPRMRRRGRTRGSIVLGAPPGDAHGMPVALLGDLLRQQGFKVYDLGADVPAASFVETAAAAERLLGVGIGATTTGNDRSVRGVIRSLRREVDVPVVVGGGGIEDGAHAGRLGADGWGPTASEALEAFDQVARSGELPDTARAS